MGDVEHFESYVWGTAPIVRRGVGDSFTDIWSVEALDDFLAGAVRRPLVRLIADGEPIPAHDYTMRARLGGAEHRDVVDPDAVARHFTAGATVVAQSLHRAHPSVRRFSEELADEVAHPVQANSYLTPARSAGLAPHADRHDVFVLQVAGSKTWEVEGIGPVELRAGDTAYVPAGCRHSAASTDEPSLHLTIGILRVTYRTVLRRALREGPALLDDPIPLRRHPAGGAFADGVGRALRAAADHLAALDPVEVAEREVRRRVVRPPRPGALRRAAVAATIAADTVIERGKRPWTIEPAPGADGGPGGRVEVTAGDVVLRAPAVCRPALHQLAGADPVRVSSLTGLDADGRVILARRLVGAGLCTVVTT